MAKGEGCGVKTIQDSLWELGMKSRMHLVRISKYRFDQFSTIRNDFENHNFEMSDKVVHNIVNT